MNGSWIEDISSGFFILVAKKVNGVRCLTAYLGSEVSVLSCPFSGIWLLNLAGLADARCRVRSIGAYGTVGLYSTISLRPLLQALSMASSPAL